MELGLDVGVDALSHNRCLTAPFRRSYPAAKPSTPIVGARPWCTCSIHPHWYSVQGRLIPSVSQQNRRERTLRAEQCRQDKGIQVPLPRVFNDVIQALAHVQEHLRVVGVKPLECVTW